MILERKAIKLLALAEEYQLRLLKKSCNELLLAFKSPRLEFVTLGEKYNLSELHKKAIKDCAAKISTMSIENQLNKPENKEISFESLYKISRYVLRA